MKAMRRANVRAASAAPTASAFAGGSMASSIGRAMTVPNPFRKVRRGICQVLFITMFWGRLTDEITLQTLQTQGTNLAEYWSDGALESPTLHSLCSSRRLRHLFFLTAPHFERRALHDFQNQRRKLVAVFRQALGDLVHGAFVIILQAATQRVGQHFFGQTTNEVIALAFEQNGFQAIRPIEGLARDQFAGGVDREIAFLLAPLANAVEILQTKTNR